MEIRFGKTLEALIEEQNAENSRQKFCMAVTNYFKESDQGRIKSHITPSVLSQYITEKTKPSFYVLVALAQTLKVSLDYLVFGTDANSTLLYDEMPALRYVDRSIANLERRNEQNRQVYLAAAQILAGQIEETVQKAVDKVQQKATPVDSLAGIQGMERTMAIEKFSDETWIATRNLQLNIIKTSETEAEGPFFSTVFDNLRQGRIYHFLLPKMLDHDWREEVESYRALLKARHLTPQQLKGIQFKETTNFPLTGVTFCRINVSSLQTKEPFLHADIQGSLYRDGQGQQWIGYIQPPTVGARADWRMDTDHIKNGLPFFESMWKNAGPLLTSRD